MVPNAPEVQPRREPAIEKSVLDAAKVPLIIALVSFLALMLLVLMPVLASIFLDRFIYGAIPNVSNISFFVVVPHLVLLIITIVSAIIAYRIIIASGAKSKVVIPDQDYDLLAPLVAQGKTEAIDQYVRLSSLGGFTGTFTKLGLTGLPLATIALTIAFSIMALFRPEQFLDLAKLTLGAFIGSFVQRQVETRNLQSRDESKAASSP